MSEDSSNRRISLKNDISNSQNFTNIMLEVRRIYIIGWTQIFVGFVILISQIISIGSNYEFATRSLTGIWTSWFFLLAGGLSIFWSYRCTYHGLLAVIILQCISTTMTIPLLTACSIILGYFPFVWEIENFGLPLVISSYCIFSSNIIMIISSLFQLLTSVIVAYKSYRLVYTRTSSNGEIEQITQMNNFNDDEHATDIWNILNSNFNPGSCRENNENRYKIPNDYQMDFLRSQSDSEDPSFTKNDIETLKYSGVGGILIGILIFIVQTILYGLNSKNDWTRQGIGFWASAYIFSTGFITIYNSWKKIQNQINALLTFLFQFGQLLLSITIVTLGLYILVLFSSCLQEENQVIKYVSKNPDCQSILSNFIITILGGILSITGIISSLLSIFTLLTFCGNDCMISGATVYPTL